MIIGNIRGQVLTIKKSIIAADTLNYLTAQFTFIGIEWEDLIKIAHFSNGLDAIDIELTEGHIRAEDGLNLTAGKWKVSITGEKFEDNEVVKRVTTTIADITVLPSGVADGEPIPSLPSYGEQILAEVQEVKTDLGEVQEQISEIQEEVVKVDKKVFRFIVNGHQSYEGGGITLDTNNLADFREIINAADPEKIYDIVNSVEFQVVFITSTDEIAFTKEVYVSKLEYQNSCVELQGFFIIGNFSQYTVEPIAPYVFRMYFSGIMGNNIPVNFDFGAKPYSGSGGIGGTIQGNIISNGG